MLLRKKFKLFPKNLWDYSFTYWWIVSLINILGFDLMWMGETTFRPMSLTSFWIFLLLGTTLLAFPAVFSRRGYINALVILVADILMIANLMYCRTYFNAIPAHSYLLAGNLADFTSSVADSFKWYFALLPLFTLAAYLFYVRAIPKNRQNKGWKPYFATLCLLALIAWGIDAFQGGTRKKMDEMRESPYEASCIVPVYGIPGFVIHDYLKSSEKLTPEDERMVKEWLSSHEAITSFSPSDSLSLSEPRKNLILILCESLENWPLGKTVEGIEITPFLNSVLEDSTTFYAPKVVSQVGNGRSIDAQLLILSGMLPMRHGVYAYDGADNLYFTLPKAIKERGGRSYLLTCDKPYVWNQARVANAFGIDTIISAGDFDMNETVGPRRRLSDGSFMIQSVEKLKSGEIWREGENAFLMWVTYSGHNPFNLPEKLRRVKFEGDYPEIIKNYLVTANYTDHSLSLLIEYLKTRPDWEETLVVITGDHEGLASDRKEALSNPNSARFVDPGQHTPLIILNSPYPGKFEETMGEIDIYSTVIDLMGLNDYPWKGMGNSVLNPSFPGIAVGSLDDLQGDTTQLDSERIADIKQARNISDLILRFNLLESKN